VALPAFAAARRAAALLLLLTAGRAAIDRHFLAAGPTAANAQQSDGTEGQTNGRRSVRQSHRLCSAYSVA